jgi:uncharacterized protein
MPRSLHSSYKWSDLGAFAARSVTLSGEIGLDRLARFAPLLHTADGSVRASLGFGQRNGGYVTVDLRCEATPELLCQRCLEPFRYPMSERVRLALLETASMEAYLPDGCEPVVLEGERLVPADLIEDELIVSLPLVPRHIRINECGSLARRIRVFDPRGAAPTSCLPHSRH